jgi:hypothetical protein
MSMGFAVIDPSANMRSNLQIQGTWRIEAIVRKTRKQSSFGSGEQFRRKEDLIVLD